MPVPLRVRLATSSPPASPATIVKAVRVESPKTRASSSTLEWITGLAVFEFGNVAVSVGPLGTVCGIQLAALFQSSLAGLTFHIALPARASIARARLRRIKSLAFISYLFELRLD